MKKSIRQLSAIAVVSALVGALLAIPAPALATDRGELVLKGSTGPVTKTYPALIGVTANSGTGATNPTTCREAHRYCDVIVLKVDPEDRYSLFSVVVTLTWPNPRSSSNASGNDLNIAVWTQDPVVVYCCRNSRTVGDTYPETASMGADNPDPSEYILIVDNTAGVNNGYTLKAEFVETDLGPGFDRPKREDGSLETFSPTPTKKANPTSDFGGDGEEQETITVKVPGPDGELIDVEIPLVKAAGVFAKAESTSSPVVAIILGLLGLGLALFLYFFVWRRHRREAT